MWYNKYQKKILYVLMIEGEVAYVMKIAIIDSGVDQSFFQEGWRVIEYVICDGKFIQSKRIKCSNQCILTRYLAYSGIKKVFAG